MDCFKSILFVHDIIWLHNTGLGDQYSTTNRGKHCFNWPLINFMKKISRLIATAGGAHLNPV